MNAPVGRAEPILKVEGASKTYGTFRALDAVSFEVQKGEVLAVVGESGSGKSTVAKAVLRLIEADAGRALWKGRDLFTMPARELHAMRRAIQMVFQDPTQSLNPRMSVFRIIAEAWVDPPRDPAQGPLARAGRRAARAGRPRRPSTPSATRTSSPAASASASPSPARWRSSPS